MYMYRSPPNVHVHGCYGILISVETEGKCFVNKSLCFFTCTLCIIVACTLYIYMYTCTLLAHYAVTCTVHVLHVY